MHKANSQQAKEDYQFELDLAASNIRTMQEKIAKAT